MQKTKKDTLVNSLLDARKSTLDKINKDTIQFHGEVFGMKVYSWTKAKMEESLNAIKNLDNPVIWVMSSETNHDFSEDKLWLANEVEAIISFGAKNKQMRYDLESNVAFYARKNDLNGALELLKSVSNPGNTVFFSPGKGETARLWESEFQNFVNGEK